MNTKILTFFLIIQGVPTPLLFGQHTHPYWWQNKELSKQKGVINKKSYRKNSQIRRPANKRQAMLLKKITLIFAALNSALIIHLSYSCWEKNKIINILQQQLQAGARPNVQPPQTPFTVNRPGDAKIQSACCLSVEPYQTFEEKLQALLDLHKIQHKWCNNPTFFTQRINDLCGTDPEKQARANAVLAAMQLSRQDKNHQKVQSPIPLDHKKSPMTMDQIDKDPSSSLVNHKEPVTMDQIDEHFSRLAKVNGSKGRPNKLCSKAPG